MQLLEVRLGVKADVRVIAMDLVTADVQVVREELLELKVVQMDLVQELLQELMVQSDQIILPVDVVLHQEVI